MNKFFKGIGFYLVIFIIIVGIVQFSGKPAQKVETLEFSKVDFSTSEPLPNTLIEIYKVDTDELVYSERTDENGKIIRS